MRWCLVLLYCSLSVLVTTTVYAQNNPDDVTKKKRTTELSEEELKRSIGRMGEVDIPPEDFEFSEAEQNLWLSDHLANIKVPLRLYYEFTKTGSYEEGFSDAVYLTILNLNPDGSKNTSLDFFTGQKKQTIHPENVTNVTGNPVLGIYMQGDVLEMSRITDGHWRHFIKQINVALRESATVEPIYIEFKGEKLPAKKVSFSPYIRDPHRVKFEKFAEKRYEIILSDRVPGNLYMIKTTVLENGSSTPLMQETLTLIDSKPLSQNSS